MQQAENRNSMISDIFPVRQFLSTGVHI